MEKTAGSFLKKSPLFLCGEAGCGYCPEFAPEEAPEDASALESVPEEPFAEVV